MISWMRGWPHPSALTPPSSKSCSPPAVCLSSQASVFAASTRFVFFLGWWGRNGTMFGSKCFVQCGILGKGHLAAFPPSGCPAECCGCELTSIFQDPLGSIESDCLKWAINRAKDFIEPLSSGLDGSHCRANGRSEIIVSNMASIQAGRKDGTEQSTLCQSASVHNRLRSYPGVLVDSRWGQEKSISGGERLETECSAHC